MKQVIQNVDSGETLVTEVAAPAIQRGCLLIKSEKSLISTGTEKVLVEFANAGWIARAKSQPEKVKLVFEKIGTDGLLTTVAAVKAKLDQPVPLGYSNVGIVAEKDAEISGIEIGDRVVSNGPHAEIVSVPKNLCAKIPEGVSEESAVFAVIGAIGLQGIRLAEPTLGECFVVTGLGVIGLLVVQMLKANGCHVIGIDPDPDRLKTARTFGAETIDISAGEDPVEKAYAFSGGYGVDGVIITAATKSSEPTSQAAKMCRKRGRIVLVGVTGMTLDRSEFYKKELFFQVSCSYGPGRYDPDYELEGRDYPIGYVRWTEKRNFETVLELMASGKIDPSALITHKFDVEEAPKAYDLLREGKEPHLGIIFEYHNSSVKVDQNSQTIRLNTYRPNSAIIGQNIGVIGAGNFAGRVMLPAFKHARASMMMIASSGGLSATYMGKKFGFLSATSDAKSVVEDDGIGTLVILSRHDTHAQLVCDGLAAGKNVFVEKPLALNKEELEKIELLYSRL